MFDSVFSVITIIAVASVFIFYFFIKKKENKDWVYAIYFVTVLAMGTVLYSLGLSYKNDADTSFSLFFVIARAFGLALKTFGGDFSAAYISALAQDNTLVLVAAVVQYFAAVILTFLIAIKLFGKNILNRIHIFVNSFRSKYIVIGSSEQAEIFLESFDYKKRRRTTVVLEHKQKDKKKDLMFKGFAVVVIGEAQDTGRNSKNANKKDIITETYEALKLAGFKRNKKDTKIIAMAEEDETNMLVASIVVDYISGIVGSEKNDYGRVNELTNGQEEKLEAIKLSAYIMYEYLERTEHFAFAEYALGRVRFFNTHEVRARKFMFENPITSLIPPEWINKEKARLYNDTDKGHDKKYRIGNIFVGYGSTNQHMLKKSVCNYQLLGTDYNALIIDKDAKNLEKQFQNSAAGLFNKKDEKTGKIMFGSELLPNPDGKIYFPNPEENYDIKFAEFNVLSSEFYERIIGEISGKDNKNGLDFVSVIIALSSDKLSIETALELRQKLYERKLLKINPKNDRVRIFVKIAKNSIFSNSKILNDKNDIENIITTFGTIEEILTEDYIVHEKLDFIAKRIANDYWKTATGGTGIQNTNFVTKWDSLTEFKRDSNRYAAMAIRTKLNLLGFDLTDSFTGTDEEITEKYNIAYNIKVAETQREEKAKGKFVDFAERGADEKKLIIDNARNNLARLEHQRWNTLHLLSGWTKLAKTEVVGSVRQNEKAKQHACITTFEGLTELREQQANNAVAQAKKDGKELSQDKAQSDADTVCYDFDVMDNLLGILENAKFKVILRRCP